MNFFRTFLDSFRARVVSVKTYITEFVFGGSSISSRIVHKPFPDSLENEGSVDEDVYYRWMYRMYLNMTKVVKYRRWTFAEYKAVLTRDRLL